ncbi:MAG: DNA recombination protein RmuC, partial [Aureibaculum sp.]
MEQYLLIGFVFIAALIIGGFIGKLLSKIAFEKTNAGLQERNAVLTESKLNAERTINQLQLEQKQQQAEKENIIKVNIQQDGDIKYLNEKLNEQKEELNKIQEKFTKEFEN